MFSRLADPIPSSAFSYNSYNLDGVKCTFLFGSQLSLPSSKGTSIAHCPLSNSYFSAVPFPLREALNENVKVGLGTDVAGGYSLDMRQLVAVSRMREGSRMMEAGVAIDSKLSIDWKEVLFLATRAGAMALGLHGIFGVGLPFDAQESELEQFSFVQAFFLLKKKKQKIFNHS